tara:strand:- start:953 stop:1072 length:120 start_codon:yes stop_codon:yes gene_type:complete
MSELEYYKYLLERQIAFTGEKMKEIKALKKAIEELKGSL